MSLASTLLADAATLLSYYLQQIIPKHISSYVKDSFNFCDTIYKLGTLPAHAKLFTADAISAFTNMDTFHAHKILISWTDYLQKNNLFPANFLIGFIIDLSYLITTHNAFSFANTYFLQFKGTAIGSLASNELLNMYIG